MKKALHFVSFLMIATLLFSCSKKDDGGAPGNNNGDATWKFGAYTYSKGTSAQDSQNSDGKTITSVVVSTTGDGGGYGAYSGSALTMTFYSNLGEGQYTIAPTEVVVANPGTRFINIDCTIGTAVNTGSLLYTAAGNTGVTANVTKDDKGKFHITVSNAVTLKKKVAVGGGITGAQDTYQLTANNVF
ncbi:hypothetical protein ACTJJ0_32305 [Chitinophaga sp. 22321]|uniref:Lipocalin-like domain-containing protein n=1 Tax=Chitinophaga hostae TaxID=2831022 RepID=A0ABS5IXN3_9BACT|nr:hypothetical protein [Chitinophaga hostae]MBS0027598.1 hypothetical protein [Chitinophaga hostae]